LAILPKKQIIGQGLFKNEQTIDLKSLRDTCLRGECAEYGTTIVRRAISHLLYRVIESGVVRLMERLSFEDNPDYSPRNLNVHKTNFLFNAVHSKISPQQYTQT